MNKFVVWQKFSFAKLYAVIYIYINKTYTFGYKAYIVKTPT